MPFRLEHITLAERVELGSRLVLSSGQYGLVTSLARQYGTSRQFLYDLRDRADAALEAALAAGRPGRPPLERRLLVDRLSVERAILVLNQVAYASVRSVQVCLAELLQVRPSLGTIEGVLAEAAKRAEALLVTTSPTVAASPVGLLVADELYAAKQPVLGVVEHRSGAILALSKADSAEETAWGCTFLDLESRLGPITKLTTDGGNGLRAGAKAAGLSEPGLDHWHSLRELGRVCRALEEDAYRRLRLAERSQKAAQIEAYRSEHRGRRPRPGQPLKAPSDPLSVAKAQAESAAAIWRFDSATIVFAAVAEVLGPIDPRTGRVHRPNEVLADLGAGAALLREIGGAAHAARLLKERAESLVGYLRALETALGPSRAVLGEAVVDFLTWAWQHRGELGLEDAAAAWPAAPEQADQVWRALDEAVRATGMAENLNSLLAFHRATHRGLPDNVLALFKVYRNHRVYPRGKRALASPLELLGLPSPDWLDALGYGRPKAPSTKEPPTNRTLNLAQSVNTLAA